MRLALRAEDDYWVAYYAQQGTMDGAIKLGTVHVGAIVSNPERKTQWLRLMQSIAEDLSAGVTGSRPSWAPARPV